MAVTAFLIISVLILGLGAISEKLKMSMITAPMICVIFGYICGPAMLGVIPAGMDIGAPITHVILEITLLIILFSDASRIRLPGMWTQEKVTMRLLTTGMGLTVIFGMLVAVLLFPHLGFFRAALLGALLTPTDIALGQAVVHTPYIPEKWKRALRLESGLNDGFMLPVILFLSICDSIWTGFQYTGFWFWYFISQFGGGIFVGLAVGYLGYYVLCLGCVEKRMSNIFEQLSGIALALLAYSLSIVIGGNGFLSAFVAGLTLANIGTDIPMRFVDFTEAQSQFFSLITFLIFGALIVPSALDQLSWEVLLYAVLSLTVIRMIPVAIALRGLKLNWPTVSLLGWFGPRGIVSILFGLLVLETFTIAAREEIFHVVATTVLLSVFVHGITTIPISKWYGRL